MQNYLINKILATLDRRITYAEYIEAALYHPEYGYYMTEKQKIGRGGDFYTTSNVSSLYGKMLAKWFRKKQEEYGLPAAVCELGAGNGRFAKAFMEEWKNLSPDPLNYYVVETSPYHRKLQKESIPFESFFQIKQLGEIAPFNGLIFSNEFFDALPVHVIQKMNGYLKEIMVIVEGGELTEEPVPLTNAKIIRFLENHKIQLTEKQRMEIPLQMEEVITEIAAALKKGLVVTVDYGYTKDEWMEPSRRDGSLRGYSNHRMIENVLSMPGTIDITSHVHFDALIKQGEENSLNFFGKLRQDEFLLETGILQELEENYDPNPFSEKSKRNRAIRSLIMPGGISSSFHVIVQQKALG